MRRIFFIPMQNQMKLQSTQLTLLLLNAIMMPCHTNINTPFHSQEYTPTPLQVASQHKNKHDYVNKMTNRQGGLFLSLILFWSFFSSENDSRVWTSTSTSSTQATIRIAWLTLSIFDCFFCCLSFCIFFHEYFRWYGYYKYILGIFFSLSW